MNDQKVSYKTAKLAKDKGFKMENHFGFVTKLYRKTTKTLISYWKTGRSKLSDLVYAPTQTELRKWLREVHFLEVEPQLNDSLYRKLHKRGRNKKCLNYHWTIITNINDKEFVFNKFYSEDTYKTFEEALEAGMYKALQTII